MEPTKVKSLKKMFFERMEDFFNDESSERHKQVVYRRARQPGGVKTLMF